jgi:hypothetical protein
MTYCVRQLWVITNAPFGLIIFYHHFQSSSQTLHNTQSRKLTALPHRRHYTLYLVRMPACSLLIMSGRIAADGNHSGSFNTVFLYVLALNTRTRALSVESQHSAFGPHQWITTNAARDRLYATTWSWPPALYSWKIDSNTNRTPTLSFLNQALISKFTPPLFTPVAD